MKKLKKLKSKLKSDWKHLAKDAAKIKDQLFSHKKLLQDIAVGCLLGLAAGLVAVKAPELRDDWLRTKVGSKSYRILQPGVGSGTGFMLQAPSGISYLITNDHVCEMSKDKLHLMALDDNGEMIPRRILERSPKTDLCVMEGMPGIKGLKLSSGNPEAGDILTAIGHPAGYLTTLTKGQLIMRKDIFIFAGMISAKVGDGPEELPPPFIQSISEEECHKPKNKITLEEGDFFGQKVVFKLCFNVTKQAYVTSIIAQPGSSGSAVVNGWGDVVAVLFAGDRAGWSILVSVEDIRDFLKKY